MLKYFVILISSIVLLCGRAPAFADSPFDVAPTRYPFLPSLIEINEPAVCSSFLVAVTAAYKGPEFDIKTVGHALPDVDARWLLSAEDIAAQFEGPDGHQLTHDVVHLDQSRLSWDYITSTEVDFAGDGAKNILAIFGSEDNALRRAYVVALFNSKADLDTSLSNARRGDDIFENAALKWRLEQPSVLEIDGAFYAVTNPQSVEKNDAREELWRLTPAGAQLACVIQLEPEVASRGPKTRLAGTVLGNLDDILTKIVGQESQCTGTLHFMDRAVTYAYQVFRRAESRPWTLGSVEAYNDPTEAYAGLYRWSQRGIWNHRMLRQLREATPGAHDFLRDYYRHGFGLHKESADRLADASFDLLMRSRFRFPSRPQPVDMDDPTFKLRGALLVHSPPQRIEELLKAGALISNAYVVSRWGISTEPTLFYALESPMLVDLLLKHGADVNARGNFGKTALMYAIQFNLLDTAALLLERGADVNAKTTDTSDCWSSINVSDRTALMYAAENADLAMVDLLLRHGANANAPDSRKRAADSYVNGNRNLSSDRGMELYRRLREAMSLQ